MSKSRAKKQQSTEEIETAQPIIWQPEQNESVENAKQRFTGEVKRIIKEEKGRKS